MEFASNFSDGFCPVNRVDVLDGIDDRVIIPGFSLELCVRLGAVASYHLCCGIRKGNRLRKSQGNED
jgi:hypothetical protein